MSSGVDMFDFAKTCDSIPIYRLFKEELGLVQVNLKYSVELHNTSNGVLL
jgi:hypothetical protein